MRCLSFFINKKMLGKKLCVSTVKVETGIVTLISYHHYLKIVSLTGAQAECGLRYRI
jgi:hypothetical protein